jgi:hypothetical protein
MIQWQKFIDLLPPEVRAAVEKEAAHQGITVEKLARELGEQYLSDPVYKCRIDRIIDDDRGTLRSRRRCQASNPA